MGKLTYEQFEQVVLRHAENENLCGTDLLADLERSWEDELLDDFYLSQVLSQYCEGDESYGLPLDKEGCIQWIKDHADNIAEGFLYGGSCPWSDFDDDEGFDSTMGNNSKINSEISEAVKQAIIRALQNLEVK